MAFRIEIDLYMTGGFFRRIQAVFHIARFAKGMVWQIITLSVRFRTVHRINNPDFHVKRQILNLKNVVAIFILFSETILVLVPMRIVFAKEEPAGIGMFRIKFKRLGCRICLSVERDFRMIK